MRSYAETQRALREVLEAHYPEYLTGLVGGVGGLGLELDPGELERVEAVMEATMWHMLATADPQEGIGSALSLMLGLGVWLGKRGLATTR